MNDRATVVDGSGGRRGWRALWFVVWGAMALVAAFNALAPYGMLSGRAGMLAGVSLLACATLQITLGRSGPLYRRDAALASVALLLFGAGVFGQRLHTVQSRIDFSAYYVAGHLAAEHRPADLYYQATFPDGRIIPLEAANGWREIVRRYGLPQAITFVYPPFFSTLLRPLAYFSYDVAYQLWNAITVLLTLVSIWVIFQLTGRRISAALGMVLVTGLFSYAPFFQELVVGQVASVLLFLCAFGVWLLSRDWDWASAFCFAVATMIKITPVIVLPLLVMHRRWRWLGAYCCWMVGLLAFSVEQSGWSAHIRFWHVVMPSVACGIAAVGDISVVAFVQELFLGYVPMDEYQSSLPGLACVVSKGVSFGILALAMVRFYRYRRRENLVLHLVLLLLLSLAISPITWMHHYTLALLTFLYLWSVTRDRGRDWLLAAAVLVVGTNITGYALLLSTNHVVQLVLASVVPFLTLALVYFRTPEGDFGERSFNVA